MTCTKYITGPKHGKTKHSRICGGELVAEIIQHWASKGLAFEYVYKCQSCSGVADVEVPEDEQERLLYECVGPYDDVY